MIKNFSKFKRLFVFGCSYTSYIWPTWAHLLKQEINNCEFYNFGRTGSGNLFIAARIAEANNRYKFNSQDLVAVMWTSFTREDRWVNGQWIGQGNIFNQNLYPIDWVKKFADPDFYLIRDYALIDLTNTYLKNLPCKSLIMSAWPLTLLENNDIASSYSEDIVKKTSEIYKDLILPIDLRTWQARKYKLNEDSPDFDRFGYTYIKNGKKFGDGHPNIQTYLEYLRFTGVPLTDRSKIYAEESMAKLKNCKTEEDIKETFPEESGDRIKYESREITIDRIF